MSSPSFEEVAAMDLQHLLTPDVCTILHSLSIVTDEKREPALLYFNVLKQAKEQGRPLNQGDTLLLEKLEAIYQRSVSPEAKLALAHDTYIRHFMDVTGALEALHLSLQHSNQSQSAKSKPSAIYASQPSNSHQDYSNLNPNVYDQQVFWDRMRVQYDIAQKLRDSESLSAVTLSPTKSMGLSANHQSYPSLKDELRQAFLENPVPNQPPLKRQDRFYNTHPSSLAPYAHASTHAPADLQKPQYYNKHRLGPQQQPYCYPSDQNQHCSPCNQPVVPDDNNNNESLITNHQQSVLNPEADAPPVPDRTHASDPSLMQQQNLSGPQFINPPQTQQPTQNPVQQQPTAPSSTQQPQNPVSQPTPLQQPISQPIQNQQPQPTTPTLTDAQPSNNDKPQTQPSVDQPNQEQPDQQQAPFKSPAIPPKSHNTRTSRTSNSPTKAAGQSGASVEGSPLHSEVDEGDGESDSADECRKALRDMKNAKSLSERNRISSNYGQDRSSRERTKSSKRVRTSKSYKLKANSFFSDDDSPYRNAPPPYFLDAPSLGEDDERLFKANGKPVKVLYKSNNLQSGRNIKYRATGKTIVDMKDESVKRDIREAAATYKMIPNFVVGQRVLNWFMDIVDATALLHPDYYDTPPDKIFLNIKKKLPSDLQEEIKTSIRVTDNDPMTLFQYLKEEHGNKKWAYSERYELTELPMSSGSYSSSMAKIENTLQRCATENQSTAQIEQEAAAVIMQLLKSKDRKCYRFLVAQGYIDPTSPSIDYQKLRATLKRLDQVEELLDEGGVAHPLDIIDPPAAKLYKASSQQPASQAVPAAINQMQPTIPTIYQPVQYIAAPPAAIPVAPTPQIMAYPTVQTQVSPAVSQTMGEQFIMTKAQFENVSRGKWQGGRQHNESYKNIPCFICGGPHRYLACLSAIKIPRVGPLPDTKSNSPSAYCFLCGPSLSKPTRGHWSSVCPSFALVRGPLSPHL